MQALLSHRPGGPETLTLGTLPSRPPGPGEVTISVHACGVNYFDYLIIQDKHHTIPQRPFAPGGEVAGVISAVGDGVDSAWLGRRVVVGSLPFGGMAEELVIGAEFCNPIPEGMSFEVAAGYALTYGTAYYGLKNLARMKAGETLLVLGAAGGVGLAAVELGRAMGARVIAAVSSPEKLATAIEHGAHDGVVYPRGPFDAAGQKALAHMFKQACGPRGADVICDPVGGDYSEAAVRALRPDGRSLIIGFPAGIPKLPLNLVLLKACQILGCFWGPWVWREPQDSRTNMDELAALYERGDIRPWVSQAFGFGQGGQAIACLAARQALGKLVVNVRPPAAA
ncbi:MAG: NADPH:quinone oxidoreductase family protein [Pseudomonadota bacterium]